MEFVAQQVRGEPLVQLRQCRSGCPRDGSSVLAACVFTHSFEQCWLQWSSFYIITFRHIFNIWQIFLTALATVLICKLAQSLHTSVHFSQIIPRVFIKVIDAAKYVLNSRTGVQKIA